MRVAFISILVALLVSLALILVQFLRKPRAPAPLPSSSFGGFDSTDVSFRVEDVFTITGRGVVVTGALEKGELAVGDRLELASDPGSSLIVRGIESFRKLKKTATAGEQVGILLGDVDRSALQRGSKLIKRSTP